MKKRSILYYIRKNLKQLDYVVSSEIVKVNDKKINNQLKIKEINRLINYIRNNKINDKKIGILIDNSNAFVKAFYALTALKIIPVSINNYVQLDELNDIIFKNDLKTIFINKNFGNLVKQSNIENYIDLDKLDVSNECCNVDLDENIEINFDDTFVVSYTSGTSGNFSKGVELTYNNITYVSKEYKKVYNLTKKSKIITVLPLWHNYAMFSCLTSSIVSKSTLLLMKSWDYNLFLYINNVFKPDIFPGSPYMYIDLIDKLGDNLVNLKNLKICDSGGDSLPIECIKRFEKATKAIITEGYGLTETSSLTHFNYNASERKVGSLGKPVSQVKCKITDINGKKVKNNEWGLLWIKGPMVFKQYVNLPGELEKVTNNGWFKTNDIVRCDENGFYFIAGRFSDLQNINYDDIKLRNLENELYKFKGVKRVHTQVKYNSVANFHYFDIYVILKEKYNIQDLYDYINSNLKKYIINKVEVVKALPVTGTGKIKRNEIDKISTFDLNNYNIKNLSGGMRCETLLLTNKDNYKDKFIYQKYYDYTKYQAEKKYNITNTILQSNNKIKIPKAFFWKNNDDYTCLLTEYLPGKMLSEVDNKFVLIDIMPELALNLYYIHNSINIDYFGWITDNNVFKHDTFYKYLESELERFKTSVEGKINAKDLKFMENKAQKVIDKIIEDYSNVKACLCWYDLNSNNILVDFNENKYRLSGIIDAGGTKYGVKEWDLAFIKMEVCSNEKEYNILFNEYKKLDNTINAQLIDYLCIFIELDDMIIRILDNVEIKTPYCSNFKKIIDGIKTHKNN